MKKLIVLLFFILAIGFGSNVFADNEHFVVSKYNRGEDELIFIVTDNEYGISSSLAVIGEYQINKVYFVGLDEKELIKIRDAIDDTIKKLNELKEK